MKPLKLKMTAFGPYKNTETIDFTKLQDHHLFVISGATGAGKTTIFDGICFALFGTASGADRENSLMLRSHFSEDHTHTAVELTFELNGRVYRVLRQLGHIKVGNKSKTGEKYEFFEILNDGSEVPRVDRQIVSEINEMIETIIGLTQDQFKQIVMLPQGEFRKLLTSDTENKEQILRRLFKTELFKEMNGILKLKKEDVHKRFLAEQQLLQHHIQSIHTALQRREDAQLFILLDKEFHNVEQIVAALKEEMIHIEREITKNEQYYHVALKQYELHQKQVHESIAINKQFSSLEEKKSEWLQLEKQTEAFAEKEQQVLAAERALQFEPYELQLVERQREYEEKAQYVKQATEKLAIVQTKLLEVKKSYAKEEKREEERENVKRDLDRLVTFMPTVKEIDQTKTTLRDLTNTIEQLNKNITTTTSFIDRKELELTKVKNSIEEKENKVTERAKKQEEHHQLRAKYKVLADYQKLKKQYEQIATSLKKKQSLFKQAEIRYEQYEANWLRNQAVILASHLHEGDACPVCGSTSHPAKAINGKDNISQETLEAEKANFNEKRDQYQSVLIDYRSISSQLEKQEEEVIDHEVHIDSVEAEITTVIERGQQVKKDIEKLDQLVVEIVSNKKQLENIETEIKQAREKKEQFEKELLKNQTEFNRLDATFQERLREIPENVQDLQSLQVKITETETLKTMLEQKWKDVQEKLQRAEKDTTTTEFQVESGKQDLEKITKIVQKAEANFTAQLVKAGFTNEETYKQAKMTSAQLEAIMKQIEQYKQHTTTLKKQIEELTTELTGKEKVNIAKMEERLEQLKQAYESTFDRLNSSKNAKVNALQIMENITKSQLQAEASEKELAIVSDLYDVLRGQNMKRISFERYLQIDYLEQITVAANERFRTLTNGQFYLVRSDRQETHGRQSGLAIDVHDSYTGQTRDVKTLSGGEKFIASLCLALGMSDVIQSFQGSIRIDTMFIDEGFGSLDEESLYKSIDALIRLQQTGRMIGVISHVEELKSIFPAMIEVTKTKEGDSKTKFVLK